MGTWDIGPFDNDVASDFAFDLDEAPAGQRAVLIARALNAVIPPDGETTSGVAGPAVAAAAVVAAQLPGGPPTDPIYGPQEPVPPLPHELVPLAISVLDRVVAADSEVKQLWADSPKGQLWEEDIARLRAVLAAGNADR
ncbi:uncharacterized protein DUF4259 [Actinomadura pelletieri DSM 43383]|uniref:Uncharacterized protein DUF4259 n=1 Tax=Actinomadura pelletieri DSM 43383 TaxID=1120940 RepID=A0A495R0A3_9ACTN|nr:DUF4259 domain-containing protein [Actinomadura pelletieri]RKS79644.1 uncharacterized protein DUF4259 [Actinomadura pelletieri DSM 43383]